MVCKIKAIRGCRRRTFSGFELNSRNRIETADNTDSTDGKCFSNQAGGEFDLDSTVVTAKYAKREQVGKRVNRLRLIECYFSVLF